MGFRFAAIATSDKFTKEGIDSFSIRFFCNKLKFVKEVFFEEAMNLNYDDEYVDILFLNTGTFIFGSSTDALDRLNVKKNSFKNKAADFAIDEGSMTFIVNYYENLEPKIELFQHDDKQNVKKSDDFNISFSDGFDLATSLIQNITGQSFYSFENDLKLCRYKFTNETPTFSEDDRMWLTIYTMKTKDPAIINKIKNTNQPTAPQTSTTNQTVTSDKKWWQFWK
jgi:hypothetical protein